MAQTVIAQLVQENGIDRFRNALKEAVLYEKRSLAYVRRVLRTWQRDCGGIVASWSNSTG